MKNKMIIASLIVCSMLAASCGSDDSSVSGTVVQADDIKAAAFSRQAAEIDYDHPEIVPAMIDVEHLPPEDAVEAAQIIMIGEYLDDNSNTNIYYTDPDNKAGSGIEQTFNTLKAVQVFKGGELIKDGKADIYQNYAFILYPDGNTKLILNSELVPMYKGDKAIFLLSYDEKMQRYSANRLPLPENKDKSDRLGFKNGIRNDMKFQQELYDLLLEKYDIN